MSLYACQEKEIRLFNSNDLDGWVNYGGGKFYVEDGIVEFKSNNLSVLTSSIFNLKEIEKSKLQDLIKIAEEESNKPEISDQSKYLADQKIEVLKTLN